MIVQSMAKQELLRELNQDVDWVYERSYGIREKYRKVIKKVTDRKILGTVKYTTPKKNKVQVTWVVYRMNKDIVLSPVILFCCPTPRGYQYINLISNTNGSVQIPIIYTSHAIDRLKERSSLTLLDVISIGERASYGRCYIRDYVYEDKQAKALVVDGYGMFILVEQEWGLYAVTYIDKDHQGEVQNQISDDYASTLWKSNQGFEEYMNNFIATARSL